MSDKRISAVDFLGRDVGVGAEVIFSEPYYHNLVRGKIIKITPKCVKVEYKVSRFNYITTTYIGDGAFVLITEE